MKILCVIDSLGSGGAQRQLVAIARGLKSRGHVVEFFVYYLSNHFRMVLDEEGILIHQQIKPSRFSLKPIFDLRKILKSLQYDAVLAFLSTPSIYAECATFGLKDLKLVVSERSISPDGKVGFLKFCKALIHLQADVVVANSNTQTAWMAKSFPWLRSRLVTIINGVDSEVFRPQSKASTRETCPIKLIGIGRISKAKNIIHLIEAIKILEISHIDFTVDWMGRDDDSELFSQAKALLKQLGLESKWNWLGELRDPSSVLGQYDALIIPSIWEGFPNVVCEALASGLPVLGSNISDIPFLVQDPIRGFLFDPLDPEKIAETILKFIKLSVEDKERMKIECRSFALNYLSEEKLVLEYEKILMA